MATTTGTIPTRPFDAAHAATAIGRDDHDDGDGNGNDGPDDGNHDPASFGSELHEAIHAGPGEGGLSDSMLEPSPIPAPHRRPWAHAARLFYAEKDGSQTNAYDLHCLWRSLIDTARYWADRGDHVRSAGALKEAGVIWSKFATVVHDSIRLVVTGPYEAWEPTPGDGARNGHAISRVAPPADEPFYHVASRRTPVLAGRGVAR